MPIAIARAKMSVRKSIGIENEKGEAMLPHDFAKRDYKVKLIQTRNVIITTFYYKYNLLQIPHPRILRDEQAVALVVVLFLAIGTPAKVYRGE